VNDQIKGEDQLLEETLAETYARVAQRVFEVGRVIHQEMQAIAEKIAPYLVALGQIDWAAVKQRLDELPKKSGNLGTGRKFTINSHCAEGEEICLRAAASDWCVRRDR
jgi:hypothetical protein